MRGDGRSYDDRFRPARAWVAGRPPQVADVPAPVRALVADLAERAGIDAPDVVVGRTRSVAYVRGGRRRGGLLVLDPSVPAAGGQVLRAVVAHEIAHLVADHGKDVRTRLWAMVGGAFGSGIGVLVGSGRWVPAAVTVLGVTALATLLVLRRLRSHEFAADRAAVALLGETGSTLAALGWLAAAHPRPAVRPWFGWTALLADHPTRAERVAALRAGASGGSE